MYQRIESAIKTIAQLVKVDRKLVKIVNVKFVGKFSAGLGYLGGRYQDDVDNGRKPWEERLPGNE